MARRIIASLVPPPFREAMLGDLDEEFAHRATRSQWRARLWYWRQIMSRDVLCLGTEAVGLRPRQRSWDNRTTWLSRSWHYIRAEFAMDSVRQDVRYGVRSLRSAPGLVAVAVLSLGIGIGASDLLEAIYRLRREHGRQAHPAVLAKVR